MRTRITALMAYDADAVPTEAAAASVSFWPDLKVREVTCAVRCRRQPQPGFVFVRRTVPPELVVERAGLRFTAPALTALDLCETHGGDAIDHALRRRKTTLAHLQRAMVLTADRVGNPTRRRLLVEVDGREFHSEPEVFESDRWRQNLLVLDGWCVLRFTWRMLEERPDEVVAIIRRALAMLAAGHASMAAANWEQ